MYIPYAIYGSPKFTQSQYHPNVGAVQHSQPGKRLEFAIENCYG